MRAILDTGPLVAAWNASDSHHAWALNLFREFKGPFHTTEAVLTEVAHLSGRDDLVMEGIRTGRLILDARLDEDAGEIERVMKSYAGADIADASVMAVSAKRPRLPILTTDRRHFAAFRRPDRSAPELKLP